MFLFKASGDTYRAVVRHQLHAFAYSPHDPHNDEVVLLSKNREDCANLEKQVQHLARIQHIRPARGDELDRYFHGVGASARWKHVVKLYWVRPLVRQFNLHNVKDFNATHYNTVQGFAK